MGKDRVNRRAARRPRPVKTRVARDSAPVAPNSTLSLINTLKQQLQFSESEHKLCGLQTLGVLLDNDDNIKDIIEHNVVRMVAPLLIDEDQTVRNATAGTLRNFSAVSLEACDYLMEQDVMTLLLCFFSKYNTDNWTPKQNKSGNLDGDSDGFLQSLHLLWNLCESSDIAVKRIEGSPILPILTRCMHREVFGNEIAIAALHCLLVIIEDNQKDLFYNLNECINDVFGVVKIVGDKPVDLLLKVLASGILMNIYSAKISLSEEYISHVMDVLSTTLLVDFRNACHHVSSVLPLREDMPNPEKHAQNVEIQQNISDLKHMSDALQTAVEIITNLCATNDEECMEVDEDSEEENILSSDINMDQSNSNEIPADLCHTMQSHSFFNKIYQKTIPIAENVVQILQESDEGRHILQRIYFIQSRSFLCLNNFVSNLPLPILNGISGLYNLWVEVGKVLFKISENNENLLESATMVMRATVDRIKKEIKLTESTGQDMFKDMSAQDLQVICNGISQSKCAEIRVNLSRMIGDLAGILNTLHMHASDIQTSVAEFLLDRLDKENELWVLAELLDTLIDLFSEDESDQLAFQVKLVEKLNKVYPVYKNKVKQQRKNMGNHFPVIQTVSTNLQNFIKYKKKRIDTLMQTKSI